jgi:hypothetical protein
VTRAPRLVLAVLLLLTAGCGTASGTPTVRFSPVTLPDGAVPEVISAAGPDLLVGVRRGGPRPGPGVLRLAADGTVTQVPVQPATGYGSTATWYSLTVDGERVLGIGGDRGGAHGNVRWSVWSGSVTGLREQPQAFSTFGGWGAGDLVDGVFTPDGPLVVGSWQSADAGLDVAVWTQTTGTDTWTRADSSGTPLQSTRGALGFLTGATVLPPGVVAVGWQLAHGRNGPDPVVWRSASGDAAWTRTTLPTDGAPGAATAVRCAADTCAVAGRVGDVLALWTLAGDTWTRAAGVPPIPIGDRDPLPAPLAGAGPLTEIVADGPAVKVVRVDGTTTTVRAAEGPTGAAVSTVATGGSTYLLTGAEPEARRLWRTDTAALG